MTLVRDLTVLDNMMLPYAPVGLSGMIRRKAARAAIQQHLDTFGFGVDLDAGRSPLIFALQQKIEMPAHLSQPEHPSAR
jgi:ribose transport system ATP-binding protein